MSDISPPVYVCMSATYPYTQSIIDGTFPQFVLNFLARHYPNPSREPVPTWVKEALFVAGINIEEDERLMGGGDGGKGKES